MSGLTVAVVGASLGGLSAANVLTRLGAKVTVFESFPSGFHTRGGALGSVDVELLRQIRGDDAGPRRPIRGHGHFYGDLWEHLFSGLAEGTVLFGVQVLGVTDPDSDQPGLECDPPVDRRFDLIVGADGGRSVVRGWVTDQQPEYAGYTVWRGLVPTEGIAGPPSGSARCAGAYYETLGFPCAGPGGKSLWNCGIYMATPEAEVSKPTVNRQVASQPRHTPEWFLPLVRKLFGSANAKFWEDCARAGKLSQHPVWEMAASTVVRRRLVLLGDAAHMSSPRTGAGAYTAMLDAVAIRRAFEAAGSVDEALQVYNADTVQRGQALLRRSRQAGAQFVPAGGAAVSPAVLASSESFPASEECAIQ